MTKSTKLRNLKKPPKKKKVIEVVTTPPDDPTTAEESTTVSIPPAPRRRRIIPVCCCCCSTSVATLSPVDCSYGSTGATADSSGSPMRSLKRDARAASSRRNSNRQPVPEDTELDVSRRPSTHFVLDLPVVSTRLRKLSEAFFNAQNGDKVGYFLPNAKEDMYFYKGEHLMNDWEIGGTQNKWVCPSDRHLHLRAQLKSGWSVRTATARSPTNSKGQNGGTITEAEQEHIRQVLAKAEESKNKEQQRIGKMVDRLEKMRRRATGNGVTHCLLCHTEFGLLASKSYAAMCVDCRKYVCQRNCGVETQDPQRGETVFLCKICSEAREVLWKKSGAWFYKEMPDFQRPDAAFMNGSANPTLPPLAAATSSAIPTTSTSPSPRQPTWAIQSNGTSATNSPIPNGRRMTNEVPSTSRASICSMLQAVDPHERSKSPRPRIQPSWVNEKVMSSMSVDDEDRAGSSSDGEGGFAQSGIVRKQQHHHHKLPQNSARREANLARFALNAARIYDSEDDSSPESRASSTSPRHSLATPCSYDATVTQHDDARSIDSGVVQSDHSNPQQGGNLTLSSSSLNPGNASNTQESPRRISNPDSVTSRRSVAQSASGTSLVTPNRSSPDNRTSSPMEHKSSTASSSAGSSGKVGTTIPANPIVNHALNDRRSASGTGLHRSDSPMAAFMSSPDSEDSKRNRRRDGVPRINSLQYRQSLDETTATSQPSHSSLPPSRLGNSSSTTTLQATKEEDQQKTPTIQRREKSIDTQPILIENEDDEGSQVGSGITENSNSQKYKPGTLGSIQFNLNYEVSEKKLTITLLRAKNLKAMDSNGFSDPYVKLHLIPGNAKATKLTSKTIEKTLNPEWNEEMVYWGVTEEDKEKKTLRITVLDRDRIGSDFLGETRIALRKLPNSGVKKYNLYLEQAIPVPPQTKEEENGERGKIHVGLQYNIQQGSLFININRCVELVGMDSTGFSDPYCKVSLTPITSKAHRQRTSIKKRTLNPEFNEKIQFVVPFKDLPKKTLQIGVYDHDLGKHDDYIGGILLSASAKDERGRQWIKCIENPGTLVEAWHKLELDN
ncbi:unnamed protein product [Caenorhabditis angaria]|uniref:Rabphilin n=1 Tax=Caenorhabditis angaria TaxID=860376 RepID=A0A9P1N033_9PELO|nr:unnamed protein product [Caenorhabditis angaria]